MNWRAKHDANCQGSGHHRIAQSWHCIKKSAISTKGSAWAHDSRDNANYDHQQVGECHGIFDTDGRKRPRTSLVCLRREERKGNFYSLLPSLLPVGAPPKSFLVAFLVLFYAKRACQPNHASDPTRTILASDPTRTAEGAPSSSFRVQIEVLTPAWITYYRASHCWISVEERKGIPHPRLNCRVLAVF